MPPCFLCSLIIPRPTLVRPSRRHVHWVYVRGGPFLVFSSLRGALSDALEVDGRWVVPLEKYQGAGSGYNGVKVPVCTRAVCVISGARD